MPERKRAVAVLLAMALCALSVAAGCATHDVGADTTLAHLWSDTDITISATLDDPIEGNPHDRAVLVQSLSNWLEGAGYGVTRVGPSRIVYFGDVPEQEKDSLRKGLYYVSDMRLVYDQSDTLTGLDADIRFGVIGESGSSFDKIMQSRIGPLGVFTVRRRIRAVATDTIMQLADGIQSIRPKPVDPENSKKDSNG